MRNTILIPVVLSALCLLGARPAAAAVPGEEDAIRVARSAVQADRQAAVAQAIQLTPAEARAFWPLYHQYRAAMDHVGDRLVKLVKDYAAVYPNVPDARAKQLLKDFLALEKQQTSTRASYLGKFAKVLPPSKNLRFAQVESRLDLALRLELAASIPLVPIEGQITGTMVSTAGVAAGVPGGAVVQTYELTATVADIDKASRKVTLLSPDGIRQTVTAGPEVANFYQIRPGDQLKLTVTEQLVVQMAGPGESVEDGTAAVVALAPIGAKPGGVAAGTKQVTAKVTAIDSQNRKVTLQFEDGTTRTVAVRNDIDLSKRKVGDQVVFRLTEAIAISVGKP